MNDLISVIVPIYNVENYLGKCLNSIVRQTYHKLDIILINDGSSDKSGEICDKYANIDKRITVVHKKNEGVSVARNIGIELSKGKFLTFVDGDDFVSLDYIQSLYENMVDNVDMSISSFEYIGKENYHIKREYSAVKDAGQFKIEIFQNKEIQGVVVSKLFKKSILTEHNIRFRDDIYIYEDMLFCLEYLNYCSNVYYTNKKIYYYVIRKDSAMNKGFQKNQMTALKALNLMYEICAENENELKVAIKQMYVISSILLIRKMAFSNVKPEAIMIHNMIQKSKTSKFFYDRRVSIKYKISLLIISINSNVFQWCVKNFNL